MTSLDVCDCPACEGARRRNGLILIGALAFAAGMTACACLQAWGLW